MERPYIYLFGPYKLKIDRAVAGGMEPYVRYTIANYGRTPATIRSISGGISVGTDKPGDELPDAATPWRMQKPVYAKGMNANLAPLCRTGWTTRRPPSMKYAGLGLG